MRCNLNEVLIALSYALDLTEMDLVHVAYNHSKRVAYISLKVAETLGLPREEAFDIVSLALLHDNALAETVQRSPGRRRSIAEFLASESIGDHCIVGERNVQEYPFLTGPLGAILCHHENHDGSGLFGRGGEDIPLGARIIHLADSVVLAFDLRDADFARKQELDRFLGSGSGRDFHPTCVAALREASAFPFFWLDLTDEHIDSSLHESLPSFTRELNLEQIRTVTRTFSRIIDAKSRFTRIHSQHLSQKAERMGVRYGLPAEELVRLRIAADLHDIGKLAVDNGILDFPGHLSPAQSDVVRRHTYYTRSCLRAIRGFEDITEWAANHHEKLDGTGYPYGRKAETLDRNSRLMACLDSFQALTEDRPYRTALAQPEAVRILQSQVKQGRIEASIVEEIAAEFAGPPPRGSQDCGEDRPPEVNR